MIKQRIKKNINYYIIAFICFLGLLLMFYYLPKAGDDFVFYTPKNIKGIWERIVTYYKVENGRVLGNFLAYALADLRFVSAFFKALTISGIAYGLWKIMAYKGFELMLLLVWGCMWLPGGGALFAQTYAWSAGFYNYVVPALFCIATLWLFKRQIEKQIVNTKKIIFLYFLLGFGGQLFAEFYSTYIFGATIVVILYQRIKSKKVSTDMVAFFVGELLGTILMFGSPAYRNIATKEDQYRTMALSLSEMINTAKGNYVEISNVLIRENYFVVIGMALGAIFLLYRGGQIHKKYGGFVQNALITELSLVPCYYILATKICEIQFAFNSSYKIYVDFLVSVVFFGSVIYVCIVEVMNEEIKRGVIFCAGSFVVLIGPLFIVTPVGARCFYIPYIILLLLDLYILSYLHQRGWISVKICKIPLCVLLCMTIFAYAIITYYQHKVYEEKMKHISIQMQKNENIIEVPCFLYPEYIHEPETEKISYRFYYEEPWDIEWRYIPYYEWYEKYRAEFEL